MFQQDKATLVMEIGEYSITYHSYTKPINAHKTPVVMITGPLRSLNSYGAEVEALTKEHPVYVVNMPTFRGTEDNYRYLQSEEYSEVLRKYLINMGIDRAIIIASSFNSLMAYNFASHFPECVDKLILTGMTKKMRDTIRFTMEEALYQLHKENMESFSSSVVLNFLNFGQRENITMSKELTEGLYEKTIHLNALERASFGAQMEKMISIDRLERAPQCPILFITGEFDNVMTPYDTFQVARNCPQSTSVIVKGADHMVGLEKKDVVTRLYRRYLSGQPLNRMKDVDLLQGQDFPKDRIRLGPRWLLNDVGFLDKGNGVFVPTNIVDINNFGCRLYTSFEDHRSLSNSNKFLLHFPDEDLQMELILFKQTDNGHFRGVFQHRSFEVTRKFEGFIDKVATNANSAYAA